MIYAKVDINDNVVRVMEKPRWFFDDGTEVDDIYLAGEGIYPINTTPSTNDQYRFNLTINSKENFIVDRQNGVVNNYYTVTTKTVDVVYAECCDRVDDLRDQKIYTDVPYTFPDGQGVVQMRNENDVRNIMSMGMEALKDVIDGNTTKQHVFLDASNSLRQMTASQMADMSSYVKGVGQQIYSASWTHKHTNLKGIYDNVSLSDGDKVDQMIGYDITINW